jgi:hypothetical protein
MYKYRDSVVEFVGVADQRGYYCTLSGLVLYTPYPGATPRADILCPFRAVGFELYSSVF